MRETTAGVKFTLWTILGFVWQPVCVHTTHAKTEFPQGLKTKSQVDGASQILQIYFSQVVRLNIVLHAQLQIRVKHYLLKLTRSSNTNANTVFFAVFQLQRSNDAYYYCSNRI